MVRDLEYIKQKEKLERQQEADKVNHPSHYQKNGKECIEVMLETFGVQAVINFCELNAFKYQWRAGSKIGEFVETDLKKAQWYTDYKNKLLKNIINKNE